MRKKGYDCKFKKLLIVRQILLVRIIGMDKEQYANVWVERVKATRMRACSQTICCFAR